MKANSNYLKTAKLQEVSVENQNVFDRQTTSAKCHISAVKFHIKVSKKQEQAYYDKASGCSVKAQENNIFEYPNFQKNQVSK